MLAHPFQKPFGAAFVEKKWAVVCPPRFAHNVARDIANKRNFFDGEHIARVVLGNLVKLLLVMLHKNPSFQGRSLGPRIRADKGDAKQITGIVFRFLGQRHELDCGQQKTR